MKTVREYKSAELEADEPHRHPDAITDEALDWFMRLQDSTPDAAILRDFERWRRSDDRHLEAFDRLERMHGMASMRLAVEADDRKRGALSMNSHRAHAGTVPARVRTMVAAAAAIIVLAVGVLQGPDLWLDWQADHVTAVGERKTIDLPDGSVMRLNTASAAALDFEDGRRSVRLLKGEAYFDVRHDDAHPFTVTAQFSETVDIGTAFAVRRGDTGDSIVLEEGLVDVSRFSWPEDRVRLDPGQMIVADEDSLSPVGEVDLARALAWLDGRIIFREQSFATALATLRRYYDGRVIVADNRLKDLLVSGNYDLDQPEAAIRTLAEAAGVSVTRLPGRILILR
ncbi:FecR domain-containing protein [Oricola sp.]|uniref:FecR family protein n=1 Tax=Oricola sp. TaxID=1979950 RepID=UPI0025D0F3CE|nr:FecR domain-containing protein [Oricola sp.]MCI5074041.1 FecR domain-containing protein [Oricola sp.]